MNAENTFRIATTSTYRVNTGEAKSLSFKASSIEEACDWVRSNFFPNYAYPRWLEIKRYKPSAAGRFAVWEKVAGEKDA